MLKKCHETTSEVNGKKRNLKKSGLDLSRFSIHVSVDLYPGYIRYCSLGENIRLRSLLQSQVNDKDTYASKIVLDRIVFSDTPRKNMFSDISLQSLTIENAGGRSVMSEMLSIDYFVKTWSAVNIIFEKEVDYWIDYKMVDFVCTIYGSRCGISVTRALGFPRPERFTLESAKDLLSRKLYGLIVSRNGVSKKHNFLRSILHIWCQTDKIAEYLHAAYVQLDIDDYGLDVKGLVILILTVCESSFIYTDERFDGVPQRPWRKVG